MAVISEPDVSVSLRPSFVPQQPLLVEMACSWLVAAILAASLLWLVCDLPTARMFFLFFLFVWIRFFVSKSFLDSRPALPLFAPPPPPLPSSRPAPPFPTFLHFSSLMCESWAPHSILSTRTDATAISCSAGCVLVCPDNRVCALASLSRPSLPPSPPSPFVP
jgi:hypothetical protein